MNNKHLACVLLGVVIALLAYVTLTIQGKATDMQQQADTAKNNANSAKQIRMLKATEKDDKERSTAAIRAYGERWTEHFEKVSSVDTGRDMINRQVEDGDLASLSARVQNKKDPRAKGYLSNKLRGDFTFVDTYAECVNWLGRIEEQLPTSRITHCKIVKGQRGDEIQMDVIVDVPIVAPPKEAKK